MNRIETVHPGRGPRARLAILYGSVLLLLAALLSFSEPPVQSLIGTELYHFRHLFIFSFAGLTVLEPAETRDRGMCCGAGGAQMFKEEEPGDQRVSAARTQQLLDTNADAIGSACPFCMRMLTDALADKNREDLPQLDIAEILLEAIEIEEPANA